MKTSQYEKFSSLLLGPARVLSEVANLASKFDCSTYFCEMMFFDLSKIFKQLELLRNITLKIAETLMKYEMMSGCFCSCRRGLHLNRLFQYFNFHYMKFFCQNFATLRPTDDTFFPFQRLQMWLRSMTAQTLLKSKFDVCFKICGAEMVRLGVIHLVL